MPGAEPQRHSLPGRAEDLERLLRRTGLESDLGAVHREDVGQRVVRAHGRLGPRGHVVHDSRGLGGVAELFETHGEVAFGLQRHRVIRTEDEPRAFHEVAFVLGRAPNVAELLGGDGGVEPGSERVLVVDAEPLLGDLGNLGQSSPAPPRGG